MHTYTPAHNKFDGPVTNLLSILRVLVKVISRAQAQRRKSLDDFKVGTSIGRFPSGGEVSTAAKGLI